MLSASIAVSRAVFLAKLRQRTLAYAHVAPCAAAILADSHYPGIQVVSLVARNIRDFGVRKLASVGTGAQRPNAFSLEQFQQDPTSVATAFAALRATLRSAPEPNQLLDQLAADGQRQTAAALHDAWQQHTVRLCPQERHSVGNRVRPPD